MNIRKITPELIESHISCFMYSIEPNYFAICHNHSQCLFSYIVQAYKGCPESPFTEAIIRYEINSFLCNRNENQLLAPLLQQLMEQQNKLY